VSESAAAEIMARLSQTLQLRDAELATTCSIGIALYPEDAGDYKDLLPDSAWAAPLRPRRNPLQASLSFNGG
jgi:GGDEF domain-containing protein